MVLSMRSGRRLSDVAEVAGPWWQQIYVTKDRRISDVVAERAAAGRAQALVLTVDTPVVARKAIPIPQTSVPTRLLPELELADERIEQAPDVGLSDIQRLASVSGLPVVVKGVLRGDDARRCVDAGAAGVIVSGHGGRQLDQVISVPSALPEVVAAVGSDVEVFADGGVRRGVDVVIALALGARAVFLGRPVLWALAAGGSNRVGQLLDDLRGEFAEAMLLAGCGSVTEVSSDLVER
jgi:4-hydroxymandelate oxidase